MSRTPGATSQTHRVVCARQRLWNSIRVFKRFTSGQLEATAEVTRANLQKYLLALSRSGYLALARPKQNGKSLGHAVWRLARDSGPHAPIVRTDGSGVYDPNQNQLYPYRDEATDEPPTRPGVARRAENRLP
jgi:hypothetical protein